MRYFYCFYIFFNIFIIPLLHSKSISDSDRYYFSSYDELVKFFEQPTAGGINFSEQPTEFYADVYQRSTLEQAVTACVFEDAHRGVRFYKSNVVTYVEPASRKPYEVSAISFNTACSQDNREFLQDKEISTHWKIIAPNGEMHNSAEYAASPSTFNVLWELPFNLSSVAGIPYSSDVVQRPDGSHSLQVTIGDFDVCQEAREGFQSMNDRYQASVRENQHKMLTPPHIRLQEARMLHQEWMKSCEGYLNKHERSCFREKKYQLMSLHPVVLPVPTKYHEFEVNEYNKALEMQAWLYDEIQKLTLEFVQIYRKAWFGIKESKIRQFKELYIAEVDRISQEFYRRYPSLRPDSFTAIRLSHALSYHHYDRLLLDHLSRDCADKAQDAGSGNNTRRLSRSEQRMGAYKF